MREALLGGFADSTVLRQHALRMISGNFTPAEASSLAALLDLPLDKSGDVAVKYFLFPLAHWRIQATPDAKPSMLKLTTSALTSLMPACRRPSWP